MARVRAVIFDAYGTLLDVHSAMARHAGRLGPDWPRISEEWRQKQLEYTWVRSLVGAGQHRDFATLTDEALEFVAASRGIADRALLAELKAAYRVLSAYHEVPVRLSELRGMGVGRAILSNGEPRMLADGARAAGIDGLLDDILSVESVGVFKPDPRVYRLAVERYSVAAGELAFVSSNPWDAYGAYVFGFRVFWVNRAGRPDEYGLRQAVTELRDLVALPASLD
jgi:2-haloacid dehalogenase